jgi:hypothetical protein
MPYIGKSPSQATRKRYYKTASGSETSISGTMTVGGTLTFTDGEFVDVSVNGVALVAGTDYNTNTANTIAGLSALSANDQVEIVVYDTFSVFSGDVDSNMSVGGNLSVTGTTALTGNATAAGTLGVTGVVTANAGVVVDNITIDGTEIDLSSGNLTIDVAGQIILDADTQGSGNGILLKDGGTLYGSFFRSSSDLHIKSEASDEDMLFMGNDGGTEITALTLDMSAAGAAAFNAGATFADTCTITTADNTSQLILKSTDADDAGGPGFDLLRDSSSPANSDDIGYIRFRAKNSNGDEHTYGFFQAKALTVTDGSEDGGIELLMNKGGSNRSRMEVLAGETVFNEDSVDVDFRVESDNNSSALFVQGSNGNVGILTQVPDARLEIHDGGASSNTQLLQIHSDSSSFSSHLISLFAERNTTNSTFNAIRYFNTGASANRFIVRDSGNVENTNNSYGAISDETVKKNITDSASQWDDIKALTVRKFHLNEQDDTDPKMIGVVAQEIEKVSAGLVTTAYDEGEDRDIKTVKYSVLYMKAVKALQEAMTRIETLEAKVATLEAK